MNDNLSAEERIATFAHIDIPALARGIERVREDLRQLERIVNSQTDSFAPESIETDSSASPPP